MRITATEPERRFLPAQRIAAGAGVAAPRLESRGTGRPIITGYGAVFYNPSDKGSEYVMPGKVRERIMPGAFDQTLREVSDVRSCFNHDPNVILGRTASGTLRLSVDSKGLWYAVDPPESVPHVLEALRRGDVSGSSFMFLIVKQKWLDGPDGWLVREIYDVDLWEVGPVTFPAYAASTSGIAGNGGSSSRSTSASPRRPNGAAMAVRLRMIEIDVQMDRDHQRQEVAERMRMIEDNERRSNRGCRLPALR